MANQIGGAAFNNRGTLTLLNSTVANNALTSGFGGGLYNTGSLALRNCTVVGQSGDAVATDSSQALILSNTIIAKTVKGRDVFRGSGAPPIDAEGFNLVGDGTLEGPNVLNEDPKLGPLANNGGPTQTLHPEAGSPVIDAGDSALAPISPFDQRGSGFDRESGRAIDLGAVEVQRVSTGPTERPPECHRDSPKKPQALDMNPPVVSNLCSDASREAVVRAGRRSGPSRFRPGVTRLEGRLVPAA
jgi:hypothetical protein